MQNFRTYQLALTLHKGCEKVKGSTVLRDQLTRASLSVVLNLAEGSGKLTTNDRRRFFSMAFGSLREVQACLTVVSVTELTELADKVGAHIFKLVKSPGYLLKS